MSASITAGTGPFAFGESVPTEVVVAAWTPKKGRQPDGGYWAKVEGFATEDTITGLGKGPGDIVYAQFADLSEPVVQSGFTFGPTPSWSGGPITCRVILYGMDDGAFGRELASDEFAVGA
jgi:hypothetical protein